MHTLRRTMLALLCPFCIPSALAQNTFPTKSTVGSVSIGSVVGKDIKTYGFCSPVIVVNAGNFTLICDAGKAAALQLVSDQINKLYAPLAFQLVEGDAEWAQFQNMFNLHFGRRSPLLYTTKVINGTNTNIPVALAPAEWSIWTQWVEKAFVPRNDRINNLLRDNQSLLVDGSLTPCMKEFISYKQAFDHNREEAMKNADQRMWPVEQNWPVCFTVEVDNTLKSLESYREKLMNEK